MKGAHWTADQEQYVYDSVQSMLAAGETLEDAFWAIANGMGRTRNGVAYRYYRVRNRMRTS